MPRGLSRTCHLCSPILPLEPVSPSICLLVSGPDGRILLARKSALYGEDQRTLCSFIMFLRPFDRCSSSPVEGNFFIFASVGLFFLKPVGNTCSCFFYLLAKSEWGTAKTEAEFRTQMWDAGCVSYGGSRCSAFKHGQTSIFPLSLSFLSPTPYGACPRSHPTSKSDLGQSVRSVSI